MWCDEAVRSLSWPVEQSFPILTLIFINFGKQHFLLLLKTYLFKHCWDAAPQVLRVNIFAHWCYNWRTLQLRCDTGDLRCRAASIETLRRDFVHCSTARWCKGRLRKLKMTWKIYAACILYFRIQTNFLTSIHFNSSISVEMFPILVWFYPYSAYCSIDIANLQPNLQHPCN